MEQLENQHTKPSGIRRVMPFIVVLIIFVMLMMVMGMFKKPPVIIPEKPAGFLVETAQLERSDLTVQVHSQGAIKAKREIALKAEISGKVVALSEAFAAGGHFKQGEVLVTIDPADYQVAVQQAKASLASAVANKDLEQARSDQALKDWQSFGKKGKPSDLVLNIPQLNGAKASVKAAEAELARAERNLSKTRITAPFDGTVLKKDVDLGQYIGVSSQVGMIAGTDVAEVRLPLTEKDIEKLGIGYGTLGDQRLKVKFNTDQHTFTGELVRLEAAKDSNTLLHYAVAEITAPLSQGLFFNTFVSAEIEGHALSDVFAVPSAWMMANDQIAVYRDGKLNILDLKVAHKTDDFFYVTSGLNEQNQIITTPIQSPSEGMILRKGGTEAAAEKSPTEESATEEQS